MALWIPITIAAAFLQNLRFMLQKQLKSELSTLGVTFARFIYAAPFATLLVMVLLAMGAQWPGLTPRFFGFALMGALAQIIGTAMVVMLFSMRNFAVGVIYTKTETAMTAVLSGVILGEYISGAGVVAVMVTIIGVILMSPPPTGKGWIAGLFSKSALIGIASGAVFSLASIGYRGAALALGGGNFFVRASVTLAFVTISQSIAMALWLRVREPGQISKVFAAKKIAIWVGITGMLGSLGWFAAFALINATYVKALGQIEIIFTLAASILFFKERLQASEIAGVILISLGIIGLLVFA